MLLRLLVKAKKVVLEWKKRGTNYCFAVEWKLVEIGGCS
jgi:hypothetical protein